MFHRLCIGVEVKVDIYNPPSLNLGDENSRSAWLSSCKMKAVFSLSLPRYLAWLPQKFICIMIDSFRSYL